MPGVRIATIRDDPRDDLDEIVYEHAGGHYVVGVVPQRFKQFLFTNSLNVRRPSHKHCLQLSYPNKSLWVPVRVRVKTSMSSSTL